MLLLVAKGQSNAEIAATLGIGEVTVKTQVEGVLTKLGLRNRIAAAIHAHKHPPHPDLTDGEIRLDPTERLHRTPVSIADRP